MVVVGRVADARARLACAGAVARTLLNILSYVYVMGLLLWRGLFGSVDDCRWLSLSSVVLGGDSDFELGQMQGGFCDEVTLHVII